MWSKPTLTLFVKLAALWFLLACAIAWGPTTVATNFFGYDGRYTPELALACFLVGLIGGWLTLLRLKKRALRGDNLEDGIAVIKEIEAQRGVDRMRNPYMRRAVKKFFNKRRSPPE